MIPIDFADSPPPKPEFDPVQRAHNQMHCKRCGREIPAGRRFFTTKRRYGGVCFECAVAALRGVLGDKM